MICRVGEKEYPILIDIWVSAVQATHHFLSEEDYKFYKKHVPIYFNHVSLFAYKNDAGDIKGFIGVADGNIEMLFVDNESRGSGIGKILLNYAVNDLDSRHVDVNEQNKQALEFYRKQGFVEIARSEYDGEGLNYPILHLMKRK